MTTINKPELRPGERFDDLNCKGYHVIQDPDSFCFGMDAVFLANFAAIKPAKRVLDLCTGSGVVAILLAAKTDASRIDALELNERAADMAVRSIKANGLEDKAYIKQGNLKDAVNIYGRDSFDYITVNPPYMVADAGLHNPDSAKNMARHEIECTLEDVIRESSAVLKERGGFAMVHRSFRLSEIIVMMTRYRLEPKRMRLVMPYADREPNLVLIEGIKGAKPGLTVEKPLVVYNEDGSFTDDVPKDMV